MTALRYALITTAALGILLAARNVISNLAHASDPDEQARAEFRRWYRGELGALVFYLALIGLGYIIGVTL